MGIDTVFHQRGLVICIVQEWECKRERTRIPIGLTANIPIFTQSASGDDVLANFTLQDQCFIPNGGDSCDEMGVFWFSLIIGGCIAEHGER